VYKQLDSKSEVFLTAVLVAALRLLSRSIHANMKTTSRLVVRMNSFVFGRVRELKID
jgi:hypothetical protein